MNWYALRSENLTGCDDRAASVGATDIDRNCLRAKPHISTLALSLAIDLAGQIRGARGAPRANACSVRTRVNAVRFPRGGPLGAPQP